MTERKNCVGIDWPEILGSNIDVFVRSVYMGVSNRKKIRDKKVEGE